MRYQALAAVPGSYTHLDVYKRQAESAPVESVAPLADPVAVHETGVSAPEVIVTVADQSASASIEAIKENLPAVEPIDTDFKALSLIHI